MLCEIRFKCDHVCEIICIYGDSAITIVLYQFNLFSVFWTEMRKFQHLIKTAGIRVKL